MEVGYSIPAPPLDEQKRLMQELEAPEVQVQRLESIYQQKLTAFNALKRSLLLQAFSGEL